MGEYIGEENPIRKKSFDFSVRPGIFGRRYSGNYKNADKYIKNNKTEY